MIDFILWLCSPAKCEDKVISSAIVKIPPKSFAEILVCEFDMSFYNKKGIKFNENLIKNNWITYRGSFSENKKNFVYLFNEGDCEFVVEEKMELGKVVLKKKTLFEFLREKYDFNRFWGNNF